MKIIYLGPFNPESLVQRRRLPARNPAAYNRMLRLAKALLCAGNNVQMVTTGVSLTVKFSGKLFHALQNLECDGVSVVALPAVGVPFLGYLLEPFILVYWMLQQVFASRPDAIVVYNSTPANALGTLIPALIGIKIIYEIEDVPVLVAPRGTVVSERPRLFQNLAWLAASKLLIAMSHSFVAPSARLIEGLGLSARAKKRSLVLSGCIEVREGMRPAIESLKNGKRPLRILFSGKLMTEDGFDLLVSAIELLARQPDCLQKFEFHICGSGKKDSLLQRRLETLSFVRFHGFVSDSEYRKILHLSDVGLALQRSAGIYSNAKTPSKAYEFLGSGKLLIATRVGDLSELFPRAAIALEPEHAENLATLLDSIHDDCERFIEIAKTGLAMARDRYSFGACGASFSQLIGQSA